MAVFLLSFQLIGKDIEEAIEEETSGDLKKAYLTIGKVKLGGAAPGWVPQNYAERWGSLYRNHFRSSTGKAGGGCDGVLFCREL